MAKNKIEYQCTACGSLHPKWSGQCADCEAWNTLIESIVVKENANPRFTGFAGKSTVQTMADISLNEEPRTATGIGELDRVLGGGLVYGSVVLIGGDPGIGKSTLLTQTLAALGKHLKALYVTGEESLQQVTLRARRLGMGDDPFSLLTETCVERIIKLAQQEKPQLMVVDSIQTVYTEALQSAPGNVAQVRESAAQLVRFAKQTNTALFLVGHVTKEGTLAGPRVLEHMVDTVLYFEGDPGERYRMIRAVKNRFGAVNELGLFAMTEQGLKAVSNPSAIFLSRHDEPVPGTIVTVTREGNRPLLVEVQALVDESHLGNPRRVTLGLDQNRLSMLLAVLHRHGGIAMYDQDVFINIVGGVRVTETAADTAMLMAILSSFRSKPLPKDMITFGEIGLAGEIRPVPNGQERLKEAAKHGFTHAVIPKDNMPKKSDIPEGMKIIPVHRVSELLDIY
ncbi:MAG: DNA repair protein RadA [Gammaproteobacteria bacterium]|nr:DNA repair protein RadA [Gammaproteobacteria bacterium]MCW8909146.1 DNA repair protein RadA [Gammaproteobacteria bacterium]MCW9006230.1 DNA repair protein RadA [Gammaproteobacteria bacterium]MCW9057149.1 DNA repair protein RadA [Gammaproteobacteria bacterium]